jgi:hypothetical protein
MLTRVRKHLNAATGIAFVALIFAVTGVSFAATGGGSGGLGSNSATVSVGHNTTIATAAKSKPKAKAGPRGPAGPAGKNGAPGAAGAQGPAGPTGPAGGTGPQGPAGTSGTDGTNGENGKEGPPGTTGFTETLPSEKSERGVWASFYTATAAGQLGSASISFGIPLEKAPQAIAITNFIGKEEGEHEPSENKAAIPAHCKGTISSPEAAPGNLCVFVRTQINAAVAAIGGLFIDPQDNAVETSGVGGAAMDFGSEAAGTVFVDGVWVVTAE